MRRSRSANASVRSPQPTRPFRESDVALRRTRLLVDRTQRHVIGARRCVRRTRERTKVDATVPSMDVSLMCIERNRAFTEQMPRVHRTQSCVRGTDASRHANGILRTRNTCLLLREQKLAYRGTRGCVHRVNTTFDGLPFLVAILPTIKTYTRLGPAERNGSSGGLPGQPE